MSYLKYILGLLLCFIVAAFSLLILAERPLSSNTIKFESDAELEKVSHNKYELKKEFIVWVNDHMLVIPYKFDTDLASIPKYLHWYLNPLDRSLIRPALLHDYLYKYPTGYSRYQVDNIFYDALKAEGNSLYTSYTMYMAVRAAGWQFYGK